ncbi:protein ECT2 isoform X1 [Trichogramma pretiosum]|uniref:protein ECT2 isoform X1 n=1 Tax=Trichogramma pretiosum TaxID=7493 RepID=UPI0006C9A7BC|nr:protein ECT2 isoform X1 [Trichogramma pretiosum]
MTSHNDTAMDIGGGSCASSTTDEGHYYYTNNYSTIPRKKRICLVGVANDNPALGAAAHHFDVPVLKSETGVELVDDTTYCTYFILTEFETPIFDVLYKSAHRILGPTALLQLEQKKEPLPSNNRPMYTRSMFGTAIVFTGFREKEELTKLIKIIHFMGGSVKRDMGTKTTHLIAKTCGGEKCRYADTFRVPILKPGFIEELWADRDNLDSHYDQEELIVKYQMLPFTGARICFHGFTADETKHMGDMLKQYGGQVVDLTDSNVTHVVSDDPIRSSLCLPKVPKITLPRLIIPPPPRYLEGSLTVPTPKQRSSMLHSFASYNPSYSNTTVSSENSILMEDISEDSAIFMDISNDLASNSSINSPYSNSVNENDSMDIDSYFEPVLRKKHKKFEDHRVNRSMCETPTSHNRSCGSKGKISTPKRYMRWRRSVGSWTSPPMVHQPRFSYQSRSNASERSFSETRKRLGRCLRRSSQLFSKISEIVFPSNFKQYTPVSPGGRRDHHQDETPTNAKQKYTPLPSPILGPARTARFRDNKNNAKPYRCQRRPSLLERRIAKRCQENSFLVVDETQKKMPDVISERACVVKSEWFWASIQNLVVADEREYLFANHLEITKSTPLVNREIPTPDTGTPSSASKRKRKRLAETLNYNNGQAPPTPTSVNKRRSSLSDVLSLNGSYLDRTVSPDKKYLDDISEVETSNTDAVIKNLSPRHQVFLELLQTESNYVGILSTIMTMFKSPLEALIDSKNELLNGTEAKIIFGNFPPIYEVHKNMLDELRHCANHWTEDTCIGVIFLKYVPDLIKAYPPYVNFFENTKEMLDQCDQNKPRFHAFLKVCQTKPDCGRQSLKELLIKPVQRLPSISLLLNDILKHTSKSNPDHSALEKSLNSIKEVMTYINEDKRKTEGQLAMFDIFNEIDNCPPHLVSSHRSFIGKCDVTEVHEELSRRGDHLVLFLFTDTLEICKKRSKGIEKMKSPNSTVHSGFHTVKVDKGKPYKHIRMLPLSAIKRVVDIRETDDCRKVFALMVRNNQELKDKFYTFALLDEEVDKTKYLKSLCRQMANTICKADSDSFLIELDFNQLEGSNSEVSVGTLSKAFKNLFRNFNLDDTDSFATRTRMKVGRAFSFNKTPNKLKRAMSTMMSPFGSTTSLTPASRQLAQMRLASCNNLNELGSSTQSTRDDLLVAPMSVQPTRKAKCNTLSVAAIRRNGSDEAIERNARNGSEEAKDHSADSD